MVLEVKVEIIDGRSKTKRPNPGHYVSKFQPVENNEFANLTATLHGSITAVYKTNSIYVQIEDDEFARFRDFKATLQTTLANESKSENSKICTPWKGGLVVLIFFFFSL